MTFLSSLGSLGRSRDPQVLLHLADLILEGLDVLPGHGLEVLIRLIFQEGLAVGQLFVHVLVAPEGLDEGGQFGVLFHELLVDVLGPDDLRVGQALIQFGILLFEIAQTVGKHRIPSSIMRFPVFRQCPCG